MPVPTVFLSYRHESDAHRDRVKQLALRLRREGVSVVLDGFAQDEEFDGNQPPTGWVVWSIQQASHTESVVVIASSGWFHVVNQPKPPPPSAGGKGAAAEALAIIQRISSGHSYNDSTVIGYFDGIEDLKELPHYLGATCGRFNVLDDGDFGRLLHWLRRPIAAPAAGFASPAASTPSADPFPASLPPVDRNGVVDCFKVFAAYEALITCGARERILLVEGHGSHWKSTLVVGFFRHAMVHLPQPSSAAYVRFDDKKLSSLDDFVDAITTALNEPSLNGANAVERTASLLTRRKGKATLLCFDGYEHTEPQHKHWVSLFLEHAFLVSWLRCVVAGRQVPDPRPHPWGVAAGQVTCDPLAEPDAFKDHFAARGRKLPPKKVEQLFQFLRLQRDAGFDVANPVTALAMLEKMATP